ncbi:MAG TPA: M20/M25/M40 family metallo-hydrolase [Calditrichia bacterium]|nr:M20/M25/M40 family metallo-hydrolase [Calditrichia bacterium]
MDFSLLRELCAIPGISGDEARVRDFLLNYIQTRQDSWKVRPVVHAGPEFQNNIILIFGKPRTAIYAHQDSVGYMVRYGREVVKVGGPKAGTGTALVGEDSQGPLLCSLVLNSQEDLEGDQFPPLIYDCEREIDPGTALSYRPDFRESDDKVRCCYLDDRLGIWNALQVAEDLENGAIAFTCCEEVGSSSARFAGRFLYEEYGVRQALISDITWVTEGVRAGGGVAITVRDRGLPRREYVNRIFALARESGIAHQVEVESSGGSDGNHLGKIPYPIDWCFVGAPESNVHSPDETVHKADIRAMVDLYRYLMARL